MTASWLAQMGWEVYVVDAPSLAAFDIHGSESITMPIQPSIAKINPRELLHLLDDATAESTTLIDVSPGVSYSRQHVRGAWFTIRSQLAQTLARIPKSRRYVLTCTTGTLAPFAALDLMELLSTQEQFAKVMVLEGGNAAWFDAGLPMEFGDSRLAVPRTDRYRRPYEGTDASAEAMQAYLDWEFGLVSQLARDGTHRFRVV